MGSNSFAFLEVHYPCLVARVMKHGLEGTVVMETLASRHPKEVQGWKIDHCVVEIGLVKIRGGVFFWV